jgi:hypothetical protein
MGQIEKVFLDFKELNLLVHNFKRFHKLLVLLEDKYHTILSEKIKGIVCEELFDLYFNSKLSLESYNNFQNLLLLRNLFLNDHILFTEL